MGKEAISYLTESTQTTVSEWVEGIAPLLEKFPWLKDTDLVIEGGVGNGRITAHIARWLFPDAIYVGTDIADAFSGYLRRLRREIDDESLRKIIDANKNPQADMAKAIIYGNCFDWKLIEDIVNNTEKHHPLLISKNALTALLDRKANPWDRKDEEDIVSLSGTVKIPNIYQAQIHMGISWADEPEGSNMIADSYYRLESAALQAGWITERFDIGLLMIQRK